MKAQRMNHSKLPKEAKASTGTLTPTTEAAPAPEIPPEFSHFAGMTPAQAIHGMFPKAKGHPEAEAAIAGWFSGIPGIDFEIPIPEWAQKASAEYWKATGLPIAKSLTEWTPEDLGKLIGLQEITPKEQALKDSPQDVKNAVAALSKLVKDTINDDPPEVARKFHTGREKAAKVADKVCNLSKRTQIFLFIACGWQEVATFKGQQELWQWLTKKDEAGNQMVSEWDYSDPMRELREVCQRIGLRFKSRPGKPPRSG